jgi:hypothetical protein
VRELRAVRAVRELLYLCNDISLTSLFKFLWDPEADPEGDPEGDPDSVRSRIRSRSSDSGDEIDLGEVPGGEIDLGEVPGDEIDLDLDRVTLDRALDRALDR